MAEVIGIEAEGKIVVVKVCTQCGEDYFTEHKVSEPGLPLRLLREEKSKETS